MLWFLRSLTCRCRHKRSASPHLEPVESERSAEESSDHSDTASSASQESLGREFSVLPLQPVGPDSARILNFYDQASRGPLPDISAGFSDLRIYVVWQLPNEPGDAWSGIHWSDGLSAYSAILTLNEGEFEHLRFRRVPNLIRGRELFREEAERHSVRPEKALETFRWRLIHGSPPGLGGIPVAE